MDEHVLDLIAAALTVVWIPSVIGAAYLWIVYLRVRRYGDQWLLQMLAITALPVTITVTYISLASYARLIGDPLPSPVAAIAGIIISVSLSFVVPYKALRIYLSIHGQASQPNVPTEGKNGNAG